MLWPWRDREFVRSSLRDVVLLCGPGTGPQAKACGSAGANESSQSRGLQPTGHLGGTSGADQNREGGKFLTQDSRNE